MKIAVISDIHFRNFMAEEKSPFNAYFNSFSEFIKENDVECLVINGDLVFSGKDNEFDLLKEKLNVFSLPYLSNLGNHDLNYSSISAKYDTITSKPLNYFKREVNDNNNHNTKPYQEFFKENPFIKIEQKGNSKYTLLNTKDNFFQGKKCNKTLSYYFEHSKNKVLFLFINSSFYSVTDDFLEFLHNVNDTKLSFKDILELKEKGAQSYLLSKIGDEIWDKVFECQKNNYFILTFAHHPPSWLKWEEFTSIDSEFINLKKIFELSNCFITGHEHVPMQSPKILNTNCLHIENGAFLSSYEPKEGKADYNSEYFAKNWCSLLDFNALDKTIEITNYNVETTYNDNSHCFSWKNKLKEKYYLPFIYKRKLETKNEKTKNTKYTTFIDYEINPSEIFDWLKNNRKLSITPLKSIDNDDFNCFDTTIEDEKTLLIINCNFDSFYIDKTFNAEKLINILQDSEYINVNFIDIKSFIGANQEELESLIKNDNFGFSKYIRFKRGFFMSKELLEKNDKIREKFRNLSINYDIWHKNDKMTME